MQLKSIFTNSFGILISRVTGLGRDVLMASALGASIWSDIFFVAFKLPNLFRRIFAEGAFTQAFLPSFISAKHRGVFATTIFLRFLLFLTIFSILITIFPKPITQLLAWGWSSEQISMAAPLTAINFWYLDLIFIVTFLATILQYKKHFATTAISTSLLNISMIGALLIFMNDNPKDVAYALSFAVVLGGILQVIAHIVATYNLKLHKILLGGYKYKKTKDISKDNSKFKELFLPGILGNSTPQIAAFIDTILATFLVTGSVSYLFYANRVFQLPLAVIAIATTVVLFPSIAKSIKHSNLTKAQNDLSKAFWLLTFLLSFATIGGYVLAEPIVWLLFERGQFTYIQTIQTVEVLKMYMIGLIPFGLAKIFTMYIYAQHKHKRAAIIAIYSLITSTVASLILMHSMGSSGLALAGSLGGFVLLIFTLKEIGSNIVLNIIKSKKIIYLIISTLIFYMLINQLNIWILGLIR